MGDAPAVHSAVDAAVRASHSGEPGLIVAEGGFEPTRVARAIHDTASTGDPRPFLTIDCGRGTPESIARALFGTAHARRGAMEAIEPDSLLARAAGGTLVVGNLGELPASAQLRLSRLLRDGELTLGGTTMPLTTRLLATALPRLDVDVREHRFRPELFDRLQRIRIDVPPLRDRRGDMPMIIAALFAEACRAAGRQMSLAPAATTALASLSWPGNLAELERVLQQLVRNVPADVIGQEDVLEDVGLAQHHRRSGPLASLREARLAFEREYIATVLQEHGWRMTDAARTLGIQRANLYRKTRQLGITRLKPPRVL